MSLRMPSYIKKNTVEKEVYIFTFCCGDSSIQVTLIQNSTSKTRSYAVQLPYVKGLTDPLRRLYKQSWVSSYVRPSNTLRQQLVHAKDPIPKTRVTGPVYHIPCSSCEADYVGETERSLKARFDEHRRPSSSTSEVSRHIHTDCQGHTVHIEEAKILTVEPKWFQRGVKEAIYIRTLHPSLNRDGGRYNLPPVYNNMITRHINTKAPSPRTTPQSG